MTERFPVELGDVPDHYAALHAQRPAVVYAGGDSLSWGELARRANARAHTLRDMGVRQGDMVTIALPNACNYYEFTFAVWKLGATPNFFSHRLPAREFAAICALARPRVVIARDVPAEVTAPVLSPDAPLDPRAAERIAAVAPVYWKAATSGGSTGVPKIIVDNQPFSPAAIAGPQPGQSLLAPGPLYHNGPFTGTHRALAQGFTVAGMARFDAEETLRLIDAHAIEDVHLVPTMMHRIWALPDAVKRRYKLDSIKTVFHYGAPIAPWLKRCWIEWLGAEKIWELYASTEYLGATLVRGDEWLQKPGTVGRVAGASRLRVLRPDAGECAPGEVGELFFQPPPQQQRPYHYVGAASRIVGDGWESVGDMGWVDEDGYLFIADRRADMILRGGANVYPAEIEAAIDAFAGVQGSVVVGLLHEDLGEVPHAIVQVADPAAFDSAALIAHLSARLATYKMPVSLELTHASLRDEAGKARRIAVRDERRQWQREGLHTDRFIAVARK